MLPPSTSGPSTSSLRTQYRSRVLIVTGIFPPKIGGAGMVPHALASVFPDNIAVVTQKARRSEGAVTDQASYDTQFPFQCFRVSSLHGTVRWRPGKVRGLLTLLYNNLWVRPKAWLELRRLLASHPFDVVCLNTIETVYWLPPLLRRLRPQLKVIVYAHGEEWSDIKATDWGRRTFRAIEKADAFVAVSSYTCERIIAEDISADRIHVVNNGVLLSRFSPGPSRPELLTRFGIEDRPTILCLARLDERKGQDILISSMPEILKRIPDAVLLLVGNGSDEPRLRKLVEQLQLESSVIFTGSA